MSITRHTVAAALLLGLTGVLSGCSEEGAAPPPPPAGAPAPAAETKTEAKTGAGTSLIDSGSGGQVDTAVPK